MKITSNDPRKPAIVAALKAASNCRKVTQVELDPKSGTCSGNCMYPNGPDFLDGVVHVLIPGSARPAPVSQEVKAALLATLATADAACERTYEEVRALDAVCRARMLVDYQDRGPQQELQAAYSASTQACLALYAARKAVAAAGL